MRAPSEATSVGVVLAAGLGARVGADGNKAYLPLAGRSMVSWSVEAVSRSARIARTVLVYRTGERDLAARTLAVDLPHTPVELVEGGDTRHHSEDNVLRHLARDIESGGIDVVLIHDAARPLAETTMVDTALGTALAFGGAIPALPVADVLNVIGVERFSLTDGPLVRVQTPQAFRAEPLLSAYRAAAGVAFDGTDTSSVVQRFTDLDVRTFPGTPTNLKVTFAHDVRVAERLLQDRITRGDRR